MSKRRRYTVASVSEAVVSQEPTAEPRANGEPSAKVDDRSAGREVDSVQYSYPIEVDGVGVVLPKDPL
jgi:hypothetical protein